MALLNPVKGRPRSPKTRKQLAVRIDADMLERLDKFVEKLSADNNGLIITRSNALRVIMNAGLNVLEGS
jgi:uncharacterized protein (DUF4415 family)